MIKTVEDLKIEKKHIDLENMVFERFLEKNDPAMLVGKLFYDIHHLFFPLQFCLISLNLLRYGTDIRNSFENARGLIESLSGKRGGCV